jgi:hypothetical protein
MKFWRKVAGVGLIIIGFLALITPFTPGSWLIFVGLGLLGIELALDEGHWLAKFLKRFGVKMKPPERKP